MPLLITCPLNQMFQMVFIKCLPSAWTGLGSLKMRVCKKWSYGGLDRRKHYRNKPKSGVLLSGAGMAAWGQGTTWKGHRIRPWPLLEPSFLQTMEAAVWSTHRAGCSGLGIHQQKQKQTLGAEQFGETGALVELSTNRPLLLLRKGWLLCKERKVWGKKIRREMELKGRIQLRFFYSKVLNLINSNKKYFGKPLTTAVQGIKMAFIQ